MIPVKIPFCILSSAALFIIVNVFIKKYNKYNQLFIYERDDDFLFIFAKWKKATTKSNSLNTLLCY
jgi:hypothetical protein